MNIDNNTLSIPLENKFSAKYTLYAVDNSDIGVEIEVARNENNDTRVEIIPRAIKNSDKELVISSVYRGGSDVLTEIQPVGFNNMLTEIDVRPHNRMWLNYEVQQPPIVTEVFNPSQDAFTRENPSYQSINYGSGLSMVVGRSSDDIWRSFVQFDLSWFNPSYKLTDVNLRLYYTGSIPQNLKLELFNADTIWSEYSITHLNRPSPIELITDDFTINTENKYIEFNTLKIVENWIQKKQNNNGFIIRVKNESYDGTTTFRTRESTKPPELIVNYYDSRIFSFGRSQVSTEINAMMKGNSDKNSVVEVISAYSFNAIETEIYTHRKEVPLNEDTLVEIVSTNPIIYSEIEATIPVDNDALTEIDVRSLPQFITIESKLYVSRPDIHTEIYSKYGFILDTEITIQKHIDNEVLLVIDSTRPDILTEIYSSNITEIDSEIDVIAYGENEILTDLSITREYISLEIIPRLLGESFVLTCISITRDLVETEIKVTNKDKKDIQTIIDINDIRHSKIATEILMSRDKVYIDISPRVNGGDSLYSEVSVTKNGIITEIYSLYRSEILIEITPNIKSDIKSEIISTKPSIWTDISPRVEREHLVDTKIFIAFESLLETEITSHITNNVNTEIDIVAINKISVEIVATKPNVWTEIVIPTWVDYDVLTVIEPRILMVSNVYTVLQVGSVGGAYAFII